MLMEAKHMSGLQKQQNQIGKCSKLIGIHKYPIIGAKSKLRILLLMAL